MPRFGNSLERISKYDGWGGGWPLMLSLVGQGSKAWQPRLELGPLGCRLQVRDVVSPRVCHVFTSFGHALEAVKPPS
jgi:hypothetical protein